MDLLIIAVKPRYNLTGENTYLWPALPKPATYAHYGEEQFSSSMDSSINKLTI